MDVTQFIQLWAEGDTATNFFSNRVLLVLGHRDVAKDNFIQFLATNHSVLQTKDTSVSLKPTLIPVKIQTSNATIWDFDSFDDSAETVGLPLGISSSYNLQKIIDSTNELQIILSINFSSIRSGIDKDHVTAQIRKISSWMKNIDNYSNSIGLIVTNFANETENQVLVEVDQILNHVESFLEQLQKDNSQNPNLLKLLNIFLKKTKGTDYEKFGIFRQPSNQNLTKQMEIHEKEWSKIRVLLNDMKFSPSRIDDFNFSSQQVTGALANNPIRNIGNELDKRIAKSINAIFEQLQNEFEKNIHNSHEEARMKLQKMDSVQGIINRNLKEFLLDLETKLKQLNVYLSQSVLEETLRLDNYLQFLLKADSSLNPYERQKSAEKITNYIKSFHQWNDFLKQMDIVMSSYSVQKNSEKLYNNFRGKPITELNDERLQQFLKDHSDNKLSTTYNDIKNQEFSLLKIFSLNDIFKSNLKPGFTFERNNSTGVTNVFGDFILLSDIISKFPSQKFLSIHAASKIFLDKNITRSNDNFHMLSIISPVWEIAGMQNLQIILDGEEGYTSVISPRAGSYPGGNGYHGREGHPGKSAGHFFGVADSFIHHGFTLSIRANGGIGGKGTNGGKGGDGQEGDTVVTTNCERKEDFDSYQREDLGGIIYHDYCVYGRRGGDGGQGGNGGVGAEGGFAGDINLIGLEKLMNIQTSHENGLKGEDGKGGAGGKAGKTGKSWKITKKAFLWAQPECNQASIDYCGAKNSVSKAVDGTRGYDGYKRDTLQNPIKIDHPHWLSLLSTYRKYLLNSFSTGSPSDKKFIFLEKLNKNPSVINLDTAASLADDFFYLDTQYRAATNVSWVSHFEQLLYRTEHYLATAHSTNDDEIARTVQEAFLAKLVFIKNQRSKIFIIDLKTFAQRRGETIRRYDHEFRHSRVSSEFGIRKDLMNSLISETDDDGRGVIDNNAADITNLIKITQTDILSIPNESFIQFENKIAVLKILTAMEDTFQWLRFIEEMGQKIIEKTLLVNKYVHSESEITGKVKKLVLQLTKNKLDNWRKQFAPVLKDLTNNSTAVSEINFQLKQKYDALLETQTETFYEQSKNIKEFVQKIVSSTNLKVEEQNIIKKLQKLWYLCELRFENCHSLEYHRNTNHTMQIMSKGLVFSKVQQLSDNISSIRELFLSNTLKNPQGIVFDHSNLTNSLMQIQILFHRMKLSFKLPLPELVEHGLDALEADTKRIECFYTDLAYYQDMKRFEEMTKNKPTLGPILSDLANSISLSISQYIYKNDILIPFYELDFPYAYEDAKDVEIFADNYQTFKIKAPFAIEKIISKIERGPLISSYRDKEADLMNAELEEVYRWKGNENEKTIENLFLGKPVTLKSDILKYDSYVPKNAIRAKDFNLELQTQNETLQKNLDRDLRQYEVHLKHLGLFYYKCRDSIFTFTHAPMLIVHSFANYSGDKLQRNDVYTMMRKSDYILSPFTTWRLNIKRLYDEKTYSLLNVLEKYERKIDIVLKAKYIYLRDDNYKKLPFVPNSSGDYCDSEAMKKYYKNDDIIFRINSTSDFASEWKFTDFETSLRKKRSLGSFKKTKITSETEVLNRELNYLINKNTLNYQTPVQQDKIPILNIAGAGDHSGTDLCSGFQYNINDCLALLNLVIQRITNSKQSYSYFQNCAVNYSEVRQCSLEIIRKFEESLQVLSENFESEDYNFDPVLLMENLEQDIINHGGQNVNEILVNAVSPRKASIEETFFQRIWNKLGEYFKI